MASGFHRYLVASIVLHAIVLFVIGFFEGREIEPFAPTKVTYIRLSRGLGGTNLKANMGGPKDLPAATVAEQREALKKLAELKELPKKPPPPKLPEPGVKIGKETAEPPPNKKTIKISGGKEKPEKAKPLTQSDSALARINERLKTREQGAADVRIGSGGDTGQSPWGGAEGDAINKELLAYISRVQSAVKGSWSAFKRPFSGKLSTRIVVKLSGSGGIISASFARGSGNESYDQAAMRAVRNSRLPVPPQSIRDAIVKKGFSFNFTPQGVF